MSRREKRVVRESGVYKVVEIEFIDRKTDEIVATSFEVRKMEKFLVEFENKNEALMQLEFMLSLEGEKITSGSKH